MKLNNFTSAVLAACFLAAVNAACTLDTLISQPGAFESSTTQCHPLATTPSHSPHWFTAISTPERRLAFSAQVFQLANPPQRGHGATAGRYYQSAFNDAVKSSLRGINSNDVAACQHDECCQFLSDAIRGIPQNSLKALSVRCVMRITEDAKSGTAGRDLKILNLLPTDVLKTKGYAIIRQLSGEGGIKVVPSTVLGHILSQPAACQALSSGDWATLLTTSLKIAKECLHAGQKNFTNAYAPGAKTSKLDAAAFELYNRDIHRQLIPTLTSDQVMHYAGKAEEGQFPGHNLDLNALGSNAKGLTRRLLLGMTHQFPDYRMEFSRSAWSKVSEDIFKDLPADDAAAIANAIRPTTRGDSIQEWLSKTQLEHLVVHHEICSVLLPVTMNRKIAITKECFASMQPKTQAAALVNGGTLPNDLLASATGDQVSAWSYNGTQGLNLLGLIRNRENISKLIALMGANVEYDHPCKLITDLDMLKDLPVLQKFMSVRCRSRMAFELEAEDYVGLDPRMIYLQTFAEMKRVRKPEFWTDMNSSILGILITIDGFCSDIDSTTFSGFKKDTYSAVTRDCLRQLPYLDDLAADVIQSMPTAVFANDNASTISAAVVSKMSAEQIGMVGNAATSGISIGAHLSETILDKFSAAHYGKIQPVHWKDVPAGSFKAISTSERLAAVPGNSMVHWTRTQVGNVSKDLLAEMTPDQAENISSSASVADSALHVLTPDINFCPETRAIIERRRKEANITVGDEASSTTLIIILVVGVAAALAACAGFYFWRRNHQ
ncbi:hypothetical protein PSACC_03536 [Paramicrosporidium saccamoebae]|uniref:Uncharacterized protein n=1 Tax=Paramicrosporidium saccamoebae TaxID=1246581 RepID=A0A2H9TFX7_9FUNG|nr:hypothetical protein PSACC_03536 [Paramicrosporidium saccamoebae]